MMEPLESRTLLSAYMLAPHIVASSPIVKYTGPSLNGTSNDVATDTINLNSQRLTQTRPWRAKQTWKS